MGSCKWFFVASFQQLLSSHMSLKSNTYLTGNVIAAAIPVAKILKCLQKVHLMDAR